MTQALLPFAAPKRKEIRLRHYQRAALEAVVNDLQLHQSTIVEMPTGSGKTQVFVQLALDWTDRDVLVLCHRDELIRQAAKRFFLAGESVSIEKSESHADPHSRVVIASVQTLARPKRLEAFDKDRFGLVICDEVHHFVGNSFAKPLKYFTNAKHVGFTATPDRFDNRALGIQWESCCYRRSIGEAVDDGYLVPIEGDDIHLVEIDLRGLKKRQGDLEPGKLEEVMLRAVEHLCVDTLRLIGESKTIAFFPGVKSASLATERFNQLKPGCAALLIGSTTDDERREIISGCHSGRFHILCGVGVPTEGFDWPECSVVVMGRPTLSRALCTQMIGRALRVLPNTVDFVDGAEGAPLRKEAIARSAKPSMRILNFVGERGKHDLASPWDVLGGDYTEKERSLAKKKAEREKRQGRPANYRALLREARSDLAACAAVRTKVVSEIKHYDPLETLGIDRIKRSGSFLNQKFGSEPIQPGQLAFLEKRLVFKGGLTREQIAALSKQEARKLIGELSQRQKRCLASPRQQVRLKEFGVDQKTVRRASMSQASAALDHIASKKWDKRAVDPAELTKLMRQAAPALPRPAKRQKTPKPQKPPPAPKPGDPWAWN